MIETLLHTDADYVCTFVRIIAGIIIFPYGMQKLFGWFGGPGLKASLLQLIARKIPTPIAWLVVIGQSLGSVALIAGVFGRLAAIGLFIIFTGALVVHSPDGWTMNWFREKNGEGIEYFVMLLALLLIIIARGSGAMSFDRLLTPLVL